MQVTKNRTLRQLIEQLAHPTKFNDNANLYLNKKEIEDMVEKDDE